MKQQVLAPRLLRWTAGVCVLCAISSQRQALAHAPQVMCDHPGQSDLGECTPQSAKDEDDVLIPPEAWTIGIPRFANLPTLVRVPYTDNLTEVDIALIGVPFDGGVTCSPGTKFGPREVRAQSMNIRMVNQGSGVAPHQLGLKVFDIGDVFPDSPFNLEEAHRNIAQKFAEVKRKVTATLAVGGDHSITLPILQGLAAALPPEARHPVGLIHIDAHADTGGNYGGSKFHHGSPFIRAVEQGLIDPKRTIQIAIRGTLAHRDQWEFSHKSGMRVMYMEEVYEKLHGKGGVDAIIEEVRQVVGDEPAYVTFDIDSLDAVYAPGTGTPEIGGLTPIEAQLLIRKLDQFHLIGADIVEVSPLNDPAHSTALAGANLLFELLCAVTTSIAKRL